MKAGINAIMEKVKLDKADRLLVYELERNCRESITKMARKIGVSKQVVLYKIKRLKKTGVIKTFSIIIDESKLGYMHFEVWLQLSTVRPERKNELEKYLYDHPKVTYLSEVGSPFDLFFGLSVHEIAEFYEETRKLNLRFPNLIQNHSVTIIGEAVSYPPSYLLEKEDEERSSRYLVAKKPERVEIDGLDARIINELAKDSRIPSIRLSKKLKISPTTLRARTRRLEKEGIIQAYRAVIEPNLLGLQPYEFLITTQNLDEEKEKELETFLRLNPRVSVVLRQIGHWDFDVGFNAVDFQQCQQAMTEIRTRFAAQVREFTCVPILNVLKHSYQVLPTR
jgi:DNA-binding Lrp family transcriptional regulator